MKIFYFTLLLFLSFNLYGNIDSSEVGVEEKLGAQLPMDIKFTNSKGDTLTLDKIINEPVLLALVYYECPDLCSPLLTELAWVAPKIDLKPGTDFKIVTLSFAKEENYKTAAKWKKNYFIPIKGYFPEDAWTFLTGDSVSIKKLTDAVGFHFKPTGGGQYNHPSTVLAVSPTGKISRYLFGTRFNQFDLKMALLDAEAGKTNPAITKVLQFCFSYDPEGRTYTVNITRIIGVIMLGSALLLFAALTIKKKTRKGVNIDG